MSSLPRNANSTEQDGCHRGNRYSIQRVHRRHQREGGRLAQVLLPVRSVRFGLPLEPGTEVQHAQDRPSGDVRPDRDRAGRHLALQHLRHLPQPLPQGGEPDRGGGCHAPDRRGIRCLSRPRGEHPQRGGEPHLRGELAGGRSDPAGRLGQRPAGQTLRRGDGASLLHRLLPELRP